QRPVHVDQVARGGRAAAGVDVLEEHGASRGAVGLPHLNAVDAVVDGEVRGRADRQYRRRVRGQVVRVDVQDHLRRQGRCEAVLQRLQTEGQTLPSGAHTTADLLGAAR